ncbi:MAG: adenine phosphoribosyltransferase [Bacilli bacterium]|nr:adenine phosphoribosyltransferase [Bacilli bacterium]
MRIINNKLKNELNIRTEPDFPVKGVEFIDITPLIIQKETLKEITEIFLKELNNKNIDYIIAPEARGFLFASVIATELGVGLVPIRKKGKLPPSTVEKQFSYIKEYGKDYLELPKLVNDNYKDKNFYIIDDIYATGNTVNAIKQAISSLGGKITGCGVVMNIIELNNDKDVFSIIDINEE